MNSLIIYKFPKGFLVIILLAWALSLLLLSSTLLQYVPNPTVQKRLDACGITIIEDDKGRCWVNNHFALYDQIIACSDKKKILKRACR
jgi:hypothetical protein